MLATTVSFDIEFKDPFSDQTFSGHFVAKTKLTQRETLKEGELARTLLGAGALEASRDHRYISQAIAYCTFRIIEAPKWWKDSDSGSNLENTELLIEVFQKAVDAVNAEYEKLSKKAEEVRIELKAETVPAK